MATNPHYENQIQTVSHFANVNKDIDLDVLCLARELVIEKCADVIINLINDVYLPSYCRGNLCNIGKKRIINCSFDHVWSSLQDNGYSMVYSAVRNALKAPDETTNFYATCIAIDELNENPDSAKFDVKLYLFNYSKYYDIFCTYCYIMYIDDSDSD